MDHGIGVAGQTPQHDLHRTQHACAHAYVVLAARALEIDQVQQGFQTTLLA